ncbi:MAG: RNA-directed DNA polymerase [Bacteroidales bacterium]|jgi:hypothetical protein|nr:RNA-directed DNA polymerase [Bacteroidales bacterium]
MLDQSFTADNFKNIYDIENRKSSIKDYLGNEYNDILARIESLQNEVSQIKRKKMADRTDDEKQKLIDNKQKKEELTAKKKEIQQNELEKIAKVINNKNFKFDLQVNDDIFTIQKTEEAFFAIKQLQYNIRKTFKVKQSSRHLILSQIKLLLNDSSPKYVIRTDITKFFESIPQDRLFKKINNNTLLSIQSKKFIQQILDDYNNKKDTIKFESDKGVPRGIGISSYLSELYMKDIDNQICNLQDVIYYARYVDDIFIIISPSLPKEEINNYFGKVQKIIENDELTLHMEGDKCDLLDLFVPNVDETIITYLGYAIHIKRQGNKTTAQFGLSDSKKEKFQKRITKCIEHFNNTNKYGIKQAKRNLLLSLRFLCSNTKLNQAKSRVKIGIFYSNDLLDKDYFAEIYEIDDYLNTQQISLYDKLFSDVAVKQSSEYRIKNLIISNVNFKKGFTEKTHCTFSKDDLKTIKRILE